jgi:hypothetical protein
MDGTRGRDILRWDKHIQNGRFKIKYSYDEVALKKHFKDNFLTFKSNLDMAVQEFYNKTAIQFEFLEGKPSNLQYVRIIPGRVPQTMGLGRPLQGPSTISISAGRPDMFNDFVHELMHVLGWPHEHVRPDRDQHVRVNRTYSVRVDRTYTKLSSNSVDISGTPYDINSITHFPVGPIMFMKSRSNPMMENSLSGLSKWDAYEVNSIYSLKNHCAQRGLVWVFWNSNTNTPILEKTYTSRDTCITRPESHNSKCTAIKNEYESRLQKFQSFHKVYISKLRNMQESYETKRQEWRECALSGPGNI